MPSKLRRAFLGEGLDAFLDLVAPHAVAMPAVGGLFVELASSNLMDGALHAAHGDRCVAGQNVRQPVDFLVQRLSRHD